MNPLKRRDLRLAVFYYIFIGGPAVGRVDRQRVRHDTQQARGQRRWIPRGARRMMTRAVYG